MKSSFYSITKPAARQWIQSVGETVWLAVCAGAFVWMGISTAQARGSRLISVPAAGMANQYLSMAEDASALFVNPARLAGVRKFSIEPLRIQGDFNFGALGAFSTGITSLKTYRTTLATLPANTPVGVGGAVFPNIRFKGFAVGVLYQNRFLAQITETGTLRNRSTYQLIPTAGAALSLYGGVIQLGYSVQYVTEASGDVEMPNDDSAGYTVGLNQGAGLSHTAGISLTMPWAYAPSLNFVGRNIMGTRYTMAPLLGFASGSTGVPADEPMSFDASLSIRPKAGNGSFVSVVLQYNDLLSATGSASLLYKLGLGVEWSLMNQYYIRAGWGHGAPAAGVGFRTGRGDLSLSWYYEDIGATYGLETDMRFMLEYKWRLF